MYLDFIIDEKIVLEIKQGDRFHKNDFEQVYNYLKSTGLKLGILARFSKSGVKFKRVVNVK
jgi:GxxExxY protein